MRKIRVVYTKTGDMKYISHLDMNRFMSRALRRGNVPALYTEGFNPHLYVDFALPLSLGFESNYECMDIKVEDDEDLVNIKNKLSAVMPDDIIIKSVQDAVNKSNAICFAEFDIIFKSSEQGFSDVLNDILIQDKINVEKTTKKGKLKIINIKEFMKDFNVKKSAANVILTITLAAGNENNINPNMLVGYIKTKFDKFTVTNISRNKILTSDLHLFT